VFGVREQVNWHRLYQAEWSCFDSLGSWPAQADQQKAILEKGEKNLVGNSHQFTSYYCSSCILYPIMQFNFSKENGQHCPYLAGPQ